MFILMSCDNFDSTINIVKTNQKCHSDCLFEYKYSTSTSCMLVNNGDYLEIKTDGNDTLLFNKMNMGIVDVRVYQPSIHLFNGSSADGEIIIQQSGGGSNLLVCIPIMAEASSGPSTTFFSQIMPYIPSEENQPQSVNVSNWSLNQLINYNVPYYYYLGAFPYEPCNGKVSVIVYDIKNAAKITSKDMEYLTSAISATAASNVVNPNQGLLIYNEKGAQDPEGSGDDDFDIVNCIPIDGMDVGPDGSPDSNSSSGSIFNKINTKNDYILIIGLFLAGLVLTYFGVYLVMPWMVHKYTGSYSGSGIRKGAAN